MNQYEQLANSVQYGISKDQYVVLMMDDKLQLIGEGRSAFVFKIIGTELALKVFFPKFTHIAAEEAMIYEKVEDICFFPTVYEAGNNYIVMDFIEGNTLFDCLVKGIIVSEDKILTVDKALDLSRTRGLNPSDIHLKNIIITKSGEIKIIDLARFRQTKKCTQWQDIKQSFYRLYKKPFFPKKVSKFFLNIIAALYKKQLLKMFV